MTFPTQPEINPDRRKSKVWDVLKRRNSSSPSLHKVGIKNWSTRSLPRVGSFGSSSIGSSSGVSPKSTPSCSPVDETFNIAEEEVVLKEENVVRDYFSTLPNEVKLQILSYLPIKTVARVSMVCSNSIIYRLQVCKQWRTLCTDGTLFTTIDTRTFYRHITSTVLLSMLVSAGPFVRHLNLRGCAQLGSNDILCLATRTTNLVSLSLEGCPIYDSSSLSSLLSRNPHLKSLDVSGLRSMTDEVASELAISCSNLEVLDLGWCSSLSGVGLLDIVSFCTQIKHLRLSESSAFNCHKANEIMLALHGLNHLQVLVLSGCRDVTDEMLRFYLRGTQPDNQDDEDQVRKLPILHLNLSRIPHISDPTLRNMAGATPHLLRLELAGSTSGTTFTNAGFSALLPNIPNLTHLDLEDNHLITDATLQFLASLPIAKSLVHLQLSYCLELTDAGLVRILQKCTHLRNLEVDNTQAGDGMLMEAPRLVSRRSVLSSSATHKAVGLRIAAYDCGSITWVGISEILAQNLALSRFHRQPRRDSTNSTFHNDLYSSHSPIIRLKCTFEWQRLVDAHTRRCLRGEYAAAEQIGLGFSRWMMEEAEEGAWGGHARRRRRRALGVGEDEDTFIMGVGRRRLRAFSAPSNCLVM